MDAEITYLRLKSIALMEFPDIVISTSEIYRHDNAPHNKHKHIETFPKHFHYASEDNVKESNIADNPELVIRDFLKFVRENL